MEDWLNKSGATGLDAVELASFPIGGRGVKTLRRFKEGETILTIPSEILWTVEHAYTNSLLGPVLRSVQPPLSVDDTLATYFLFVRSRESGYDGLRAHLAALPETYSSSIFFTEEELDVCAGTSLYAITKRLEQCIEDDFRELVKRVFIQNYDLFPLGKFTIEDYKWALCTVWSRAMDFTLPDGKQIRVMAPFADMLNHSPEVKQCHAYDLSSGNLSILAGKDYEPEDQVFIYYGSIPNNRLLRLYGFVVPDNPNDSYDLVLETHPMAPFFEQKHTLWTSGGLDSSSTITLTLTDPLPKTVLQYLRIQRSDESDLAAIALQQIDPKYRKISDSNEVQVLESLIESFCEILNNFATQMETLEKQVVEGVYTPGSNSWAAAHVSLGEQRVLTMARKKAEDMLAAVKSGGGNDTNLTQCANCADDSVPLMTCGRCKAVKYCGRTCQVANFKKHKAKCQTMASNNGSHLK